MGMKRKIYQTIKKWKEERNGSTALLIEGARRVGKSYIVEEFARDEYESYIIVNFSKVGPHVHELFNDLSDIPLLLQKLTSIMRVKLKDRKSLVVFDEIQKCPRAREAIKFLVEDGRYDYIETGSLISIHENVCDIIIPSEEESIRMYPMDFEEFCWALGDEVTVPLIRRHFDDRKPLGTAMHKVVLEQFRKYMIIGGMPRVVQEYAKTGSFDKVEHEKRMILKLYREDISKKSKINRLRTSSLFESIPSDLSKHDKKVEPGKVDRSSRMADLDEPLFWLEDSMICNICYNATSPDVGLGLNRDHLTVKCYMGDTGLLVSHSINENECMEHDIYSALLADKLHINEGMFTENMVAQILRSNGHKLYFHSFYKDDSKNKMEVDFLIRDGRKICPIEVKSSNYANHASMDYFMDKHSKSLGQPYIIYTKDLKKSGNTLFIPIYMTICL